RGVDEVERAGAREVHTAALLRRSGCVVAGDRAALDREIAARGVDPAAVPAADVAEHAAAGERSPAVDAAADGARGVAAHRAIGEVGRAAYPAAGGARGVAVHRAVGRAGRPGQDAPTRASCSVVVDRAVGKGDEEVGVDPPADCSRVAAHDAVREVEAGAGCDPSPAAWGVIIRYGA